MRLNHLLWLFTACLLVSCSHTESYDHKFEGHVWKRFDTLSFTLDGFASTKPKHIVLTFLYQPEFPTSDLPIMATLISPSGEERTIEKRVWLKTLDGRPKGKYENNRYTLEQVLWYEILFREKGPYRLIIESLHPKYEVSGIISLQVNVGKGALTPPKPQPGNFH
ncbi:MAG: hypothetical protein ACP5O2_00600 [Bacteroidales bacterium]